MVSRKGTLVVVAGTVFIMAVVAVIAFATAGVGSKTSQSGSFSSATQSCSGSVCTSFLITSANITQVSYTDELGPANYTQLALGLRPSGSTLTSYKVFFGGTPIGTISGTYPPGVTSVSDFTVPQTVSVVPGRMYTVQVEGFFGQSSSVWQYIQITAH